MLRGLGLELARGAQVGNQSQMDIQAIVTAELGSQLSDGFEERQAFDIADSAADLNDGDIRGVLALGKRKHDALDLVSDVRDHLHGSTQVVPAAFLMDDAVINGAGRGIVLLGKGNVQEPLVMAEIEVRFSAVVRDENLSVLEGVHGAGINVDVGIQFLNGHGKIPRLQKCAEGSRSQTFSKGGKHTSCHEDKLCFHRSPFLTPVSPSGRRVSL